MNRVHQIFGPTVHFRDLATCADRIRDFVRNPTGSPLKQPCAGVAAKFSTRQRLLTRFAHANKWHFINIPFDGHQHSLNDVQSFCGANLCAPERIQHYKDTLSVNATVAVQAEALVFLAHLVGDLHQPLHSVVRNNDAGGNSVIVQIFKGEFTLHHVWDDEIIIRMQNTQGVALGTEALRSHHLSAILPDSGPFNPWSGDGMPSRKLSPSAT